MLLPPALECAPSIQPMRSSRPTSRVSPANTFQSTASPVFSTCRTLQSLLTTTLAQPQPTSKPSPTPLSLASPIDLSSTKNPPKQKPPQRAPTPPTTPQSLPPPSKKRRRCDSESHDLSTRDTSTPSTPKRQRLHPPTLPQGLSRADFESLQLQEEAAAIPLPQTPSSAVPRPLFPSPETTASPDPTALVELIMHKFRLRESGWDDSAQRLARNKNDGITLRRSTSKQSRRRLPKLGLGGPLIPVGKTTPLR